MLLSKVPVHASRARLPMSVCSIYIMCTLQSCTLHFAMSCPPPEPSPLAMAVRPTFESGLEGTLPSHAVVRQRSVPHLHPSPLGPLPPLPTVDFPPTASQFSRPNLTHPTTRPPAQLQPLRPTLHIETTSYPPNESEEPPTPSDCLSVPSIAVPLPDNQTMVPLTPQGHPHPV